MTLRSWQPWVLAVLLGPTWGCVADLDVGTLPSLGRQPADAATPGRDANGDTAIPSADASAEAGTCSPVACRGRPAACGNCQDDDGDGLVDALDPDCFSPCHDNEAGFAKRMPCPEEACYFDADCGLGNDARCLSLTPNGCDCRGCCYSQRASRYVLLGGSTEGALACSSASVVDSDACPSCTPDPDCFNPCESCELCFGDVSLPASCEESLDCDSPPHCAAQSASCLPGVCGERCANGTFCLSGCCVSSE